MLVSRNKQIQNKKGESESPWNIPVWIGIVFVVMHPEECRNESFVLRDCMAIEMNCFVIGCIL